jgi:hypothetical protein
MVCFNEIIRDLMAQNRISERSLTAAVYLIKEGLSCWAHTKCFVEIAGRLCFEEVNLALFFIRKNLKEESFELRKEVFLGMLYALTDRRNKTLLEKKAACTKFQKYLLRAELNNIAALISQIAASNLTDITDLTPDDIRAFKHCSKALVQIDE